MTPKRIAQLEQMLERGTIRKGHIWEMLDAIKQREWVDLTLEDAGWLLRNSRSPGHLIDMTASKLKEKNA